MKEQDVGVKWFNTVLYPQKKTARAVRYEDGVLSRLRGQTVRLFTPWGPRYSYESRGVDIKDGDKEVEVLRFLADLLGELQQNMPDKNFYWVILGADLYGTRINNLPSEVVVDYFTNLFEWVAKILPMATFTLWSKFDNVAEQIRQMIRGDFSGDWDRTNYHLIASTGEARRVINDHDFVTRITEAARVFGTSGDPKEYLVERLTEAIVIEKILRPIKISCVAKYKDDKVDLKLPRLYFFSERLHAPWL